jgi:hypothetical protein
MKEAGLTLHKKCGGEVNPWDFFLWSQNSETYLQLILKHNLSILLQQIFFSQVGSASIQFLN